VATAAAPDTAATAATAKADGIYVDAGSLSSLNGTTLSGSAQGGHAGGVGALGAGGSGGAGGQGGASGHGGPGNPFGANGAAGQAGNDGAPGTSGLASGPASDGTSAGDTVFQRSLQLTVTWTNAGSGDWNVPANWSGGKVPTSGDDVVINTTAAATITLPDIVVTVNSITTGSQDTLSIVAGSLYVNASSTLSGPLAMNSGRLFVNGPGVTFTVTGATTVSLTPSSPDTPSVYAEGATVSLPKLTSSAGGLFEADGGVLDLSALTTVSGNATIGADLGGEIKLTGLTSLTGANIGFSDTGGSTILDGKLTTLNGAHVTLDGTDKQVANAWTTLKGGALAVTGGSYSLPGLTDVDYSSLSVSSGGHLALPGLKTLQAGEALEASGTGSLLDLSALTTLTLVGYASGIDATKGGEIKLTGLTSLHDSYGVHDARGFTDTGASTILDGNLTSLGGVNATLDGTDTQVASSWTTFTGGGLRVTGGSYSLPGLTDVDASSLHAQSGGQLALPGLKSYNTGIFDTFSADGAGSVLDLPALITVTVTKGYKFSVSATNGGAVELPVVSGPPIFTAHAPPAAAIGSAYSYQFTAIGTAPITFSATGLPSWAQLDAATGILSGTPPAAGTLNFSVTASNGIAPAATVFVSLILSSPPTFTADTPTTAAVGSAYSYQFQVNSTAPITFSAMGLPGWAHLDTSTGILSGTPPAVGTFHLTVTASNGIAPDATANVSVTAQLEPPTFTGDTPPVAVDGAAYSYQFQATGTGTAPITYSATGLPSWAQLNTTTGVFSGTPSADGTFDFSVTASNGIAPDTTANVSLIVAGGTAITFNIAAGTTFNVPNGIYAGGTTFNVGAGAMVTIPAGTFTGGAIFNVAPGAVVDLTGGGTPSYSGTLIGSGGGTVQLGSGRLYMGNGGMTLDFVGTTFQWTGGQMDAGQGDLTNLGTMNISGNSQKDFYNDGVLDNNGTIIQTGTGNLQLGTDGTFPATLKNEAGATYLLEGDGGLSEISDSGSAPGQTSLNNAGTIRKTAGTGTSSFTVLGSITNTGTIEADSGTIALNPTLGVSQVAGNTLTAGTWNARNGATLKFPNGTSIVTNEANISISDSGTTIIGIARLATNSGSFTLANGVVTTAGDFTNSGSLILGPGGMNVAGNFTQTSTGTLNEQVAGTPASGLYGQVAVTGTGTLAGTFQLTPINGFTGAVGQDFKVMTFASATGSFSTVVGFGSTFTEAVNPTSLDLYAFRNPVDLQVTNVSTQATATAGQLITVTWQVTDQGPSNATGSWQDSIYLSPTATITSTSILLGAAPHSGGLNVNGSYNGMFSAPVPALALGSYYVLVQVDSLYQVSDPNRANNILAAASQVTLSLPALVLGSPFNDSFTAADQDRYYQVTVPAGGALTIALQSNASAGATALYISQGTLPTPYNAQDSADVANQPSQTVTVPQVLTAGTYYILAHSVSGNAAAAAYTLTATQGNALTISAISSYAGGNAGNVTIEIDGTNFTVAATASLFGATTINATAVDFVNASQLFATFNLTGAAAGNYTLKVQQAAQSATAPTTFQVVAVPSPAPLNVVLITPQLIRSGRTGTIVVTYTNPTSNDMVAPLLDIASTNTSVYFSTPDDPNNFTQDAQVLAVAPSGPAGILRPGQSGQLTLTLLSDDTVDGDQIPVQVSQIESGQTIAWASQESSLQPSTIPTAAWNVIFNNVLAMIGSTTDSYNATLAQAATYLSGIGETTAQASDVGHLWSFLVSQASASFPTPTLTSAIDASLPTPGSLSLAIGRTFISSISGRYTPGIFGLGWTTSWQTSLSVDNSGNVTINSGGALSFFVHQPNGGYLDTAGEYGTLTKTGGVFTFTDTSGTQYFFLLNGQLNYVQDTNGNRITLDYNNQNQLVSLTYSNPSDPSEPGEELTLTYNGQGLVFQVADGTGNTWTYQYDAAGHLLSVTAPGPTAAGLTTSYTYDTGTNAEAANALLSITNPDGSQQIFTYDAATGRLNGTSQSGGSVTGQASITYAYLGQAEVTATDAKNNQTTVWYNDLGLPSRVQNPRGGISTYLYDQNGNLTGYTDANGDTYQYSYDQNGNLTQIVNPLGQIVQMTFGAFSNLTSITDAAGNTTQYGYSSNGNLLSLTYPGGSQQSFSYDPLGNLRETVLQNGDPINYQYNAQGLVKQENFADGTYQIFGYDAHGNLQTAQTYDSSGNRTGKTTLEYNAANQLTSISYPGGLSLTFTYNPQGQRTQSVDQSGYTLTYSYDGLGRLAGLSDGSGMVVTYTYNKLGQLSQKTNNNGTYTTYAYDPEGNLTNEVNYANPGGTAVNSSFTYVYNLLGQVTSVQDAAGNITQYAYDPSGQLTQVTLPGNVTITYVYNAAGNRTEVITNGTATSYASNADNEITQVGPAIYTYDQNGNLHTVTDASGTTTYTYNDLNQLVSIAAPDGTTTAFQYSPLGFMVGTSVNGTQTNYLVNPTGLGNVVASYNGSGSLSAHYNYGLGLVSQTGPSGTGYYDFNASGNTVGITGASDTYVNQYSYLPFGETTTVGTPQLPNPFAFVGQFGVMQIGNNLFDMRARDYTPATAQFTSNDPSGLAGGDTNLRRYVGNNSLGDVDPLGLWIINTITASGAPWTIYTDIDAATYPGGAPNSDGSWGGTNAQTWTTDSGKTAITVVNPILADSDFFNTVWIHEGQIAGDITNPAFRDGTYGSLLHTNWQQAHDLLEDRAYRAELRNPHITQPQLDNAKFQLSQLKSVVIPVRTSRDPNALIGPAGFGTQNFIQPTDTLPYTIDFENDGSVAAQDVTVTEQLDSNLDWSTFQLGSFGFGLVTVTIPAGLTDYEATVAYQNIDGSFLNVQVALNFNVQTGLLTVTFTSLDPATGQAPTGVFDGFLPPDEKNGIGEGFVQYTVQPKASLAIGATINQQAAVVFDTNAPLVTNTATNTIDHAFPGPSEPENTTTPTAVTIASLLTGHTSSAKNGVAISETTGNGIWQFSTNGKTWTSIGVVSGSQALLLPVADQLRFLPGPGFIGRAGLLFQAWDGLGGTAGGTASVAFSGGGAPFSAGAGELTIQVTSTGTAPTWTGTSATLTPVTPGTTSPAGDSVASVFDAVFADGSNTTAGIAVVALTGTTSGTWEYSLNAGQNWNPFGRVATATALLLEGTDLIRFVPNKGFAGVVTLQAAAWDGTGTDGGTANLSASGTTGGNTHFSDNLLTGRLAVNTAPTLGATGPTLPPVLENTAGDAVAVTKLLASEKDVDKGALKGVALVGTSGTGTWQFSLNAGKSWQAVGTVSASGALLLSSTALVRFVPAVNQTGPATLTYRAWDQTAGTSGSLFAIASTGGASAFSTTAATATLTVKPGKAGPAWFGSGAVLTPVLPFPNKPAGDPVASVFGPYFAGTATGIAVTALIGTADGAWQFSTDHGTTWTAIGTVSRAKPKLLSGSDWIRFLPTRKGFVESVALKAEAWNGGTGRSGTTLTAICLVNTAPTLT